MRIKEAENVWKGRYIFIEDMLGVRTWICLVGNWKYNWLHDKRLDP